MVAHDRIRLTGLLRKKPRRRGFFYARLSGPAGSERCPWWRVAPLDSAPRRPEATDNWTVMGLSSQQGPLDRNPTGTRPVRRGEPHRRPGLVGSAPQTVGTLLSVNVGLPRDVSWQGRTVFT